MFPQFDFLFDVAGNIRFLWGPLQADKLEFVPLTQVLLHGLNFVSVLFEEVEVFRGGDSSSSKNDLLHKEHINLPNEELLILNALVVGLEEHGEDLFDDFVLPVLVGFDDGEHLEIGFDDNAHVKLGVDLSLLGILECKVL